MAILMAAGRPGMGKSAFGLSVALRNGCYSPAQDAATVGFEAALMRFHDLAHDRKKAPR